MTEPRNAISRDVAREQIDFMRGTGLKVKDAAAVMGMLRTVDAWRDVESAVSAAWKRLRVQSDGTKYKPHTVAR